MTTLLGFAKRYQSLHLPHTKKILIAIAVCFLSFTYQEKEGVHVIELSSSDRIELHNASSSLVGVEKVDVVARKKGALAAINGGFFWGDGNLEPLLAFLKLKMFFSVLQ